MNEDLVPKYIDPASIKDDLNELNIITDDLPEAIATRMKLSKVFHSIHKKMNEGVYYKDILDSIFNSLSAIIPFERIGIAILENDGKDLRLKWVKSNLSTKWIQQNYLAPIASSSLEKIIELGYPRIINDLEEYFDSHPASESTKFILRDGIRSNLTCPLNINGKPIGVIFFSSSTPYSFNNHHVDVFCEIAEGLAMIIEKELLETSVHELSQKESTFRRALHDLSNPLTVIKGTISSIEKQEWFVEMEQPTKKSFEMLKRNADSMAIIIQDLIYGHKNHQKKVINLKCFIEDVTNDGEILAKNKHINFSSVVSNEIPENAVFDDLNIKKAVQNLISNAIKFSPSQTRVNVRFDFDQKQKRLYFTITDQGPGIPKNEQYKLFTTYGKTSVRPTAGEQSSGQGLNSVKKIIESAKGEVFVNSEEGKGSIFGFWIPV